MDYIYEELERQRLAMERLLQPAEKYRAKAQDEETILHRTSVHRTADTAAFRVGAFAGDTVSMPTAVESSNVLRSVTVARGEAEHVSRAVERDARRYDGGYQMY